MHILVTANTAWNIWNFRRPIVKSLIKDGHRVTILAPPDSAVSELVALGCETAFLTIDAKGTNPLSDVKLMYHFRRIFAKEKPDVVLSYTVKNNIFGALAAKSLNIPFVPNVTGLGTAFLSGAILRAVAGQLYRRAFKSLPVVFFENEDDRNLFISKRFLLCHQALVVPGTGIDLRHFAMEEMPSCEEPIIFLMIGRLLRDKGVVEFVEAARDIRRRHPEVRFQLLGSVSAENRSAIDCATLAKWVEEGSIEYLGVTTDVRPYIRAASCIVLPSYREGAPRALMEAAAMARPVIATDVAGCRSVVDRDLSGYFCQVRSVSSLIAAMSRFLEAPYETRIAMGAAGRAKMQREFDEAIVVDAYRKAILVSTANAI